LSAASAVSAKFNVLIKQINFFRLTIPLPGSSEQLIDSGVNGFAFAICSDNSDYLFGP